MVRVTATKAEVAGCSSLMVAAAIAVSAPAEAQTVGATPAPAGPVVVLEADELIRDDATKQIIAEGSVEARYRGRVLRAERLIYDTAAGTVRAQGGVEIIDADGSVQYAEEIEVDDELESGVAIGFGARQEEATLAANAAILRPDGEVALDRAVYTACRLCDGERPTWTLKARNAEQDKDSQMIVYRGVSLQVAGVPVAYLPYFSHPDPTAGRRSGFLAPTAGRNNRLGVFYRQPYYVAISPSQDLTLTPSVHGNVAPILIGEYRKRFFSGAAQFAFSGSYDQDFDNSGDPIGEEEFRGHIFGQGQFEISDYWGWQFGAERTSDDTYLSRYDIEGRNERRGLYQGNPTRLFSQLNLTGQDEVSFAQVSVVSSQDISGPSLLDTQGEPTIAPYGEAERLFRDPLFDGQIRLGVSTANLIREAGGVDSARATTSLRWRTEQVFGPGVILGPFLEGRVDYYDIERPDEDPIPDGNFTRLLGVSGVEVRWPLVKPGSAVDWLVEPIAVAALGSGGGDDERIPNEDTQAFELDETSLFRPVGTPNYDLWESGGRVSLGVRGAAQFANGGEARALIGRRWRSGEDQRFSDQTNLSDQASDYVGSFEVDFAEAFGADVRFRLDEDDLSVNRVDAGVRGEAGRAAASARYYFVDRELRFQGAAPGSIDVNEEIALDASLRVLGGWSVGGALRRDLSDRADQPLESRNRDRNTLQRARLFFEDDCTFFELSYERREELLGTNEGFRIRLGLRTLGTVGGR